MIDSQLCQECAITLWEEHQEIMSITNEFSSKRLLDHVNEILEREPIRDTIREDLRRTELLGYRESWKLGLVTPQTDWVFMGTDIQSIPPGMNRLQASMRLVNVQTSMKALLYPMALFWLKGNALQIDFGSTASNFPSTYPLVRSPGKRDYMPIEQLTVRAPAYRAGWEDTKSGIPVVEILRHLGFPLKTHYRDGNPLAVKRVRLVDSQGIVHKPVYFSQRSLIDEMLQLRPVEHVSAIRKVLRRISLALPIVRYHTFPFESKTLLPLIDTPPTLPGWVDLVISPSGRGRLFIAMDKDSSAWQQMMNLLKELLISTLRLVEFRLLSLTQNADLQNEYLTKKESILRECFLIKDLSRVV
jgi:hypothetical protein